MFDFIAVCITEICGGYVFIRCAVELWRMHKNDKEEKQ